MKPFDLETFKREFFNLTQDWTWEVEGFIDTNNHVYPIDSDTKVISTVFERLSSPVIRSIAKSSNYQVEIANQTTYPDFTLTLGNNTEPNDRVALDIKTTYFETTPKGKPKPVGFTLGSYTSYIRNNTKNILYPYDTYSNHWVLGFIYSRNNSFQEYDLSCMPSRGQIDCPYSIVSIFLAPKVNITGLRAGSGNTANIGSIKLTDPHGFSEAEGPFCQFKDAKGACDFYWSNYERLKSDITNEESLFNHPEFDLFR